MGGREGCGGFLGVERGDCEVELVVVVVLGCMLVLVVLRLSYVDTVLVAHLETLRARNAMRTLFSGCRGLIIDDLSSGRIRGRR